MLRVLTAGESHGPALVATIEGLPAGLRVSQNDIDHQLGRRQAGYGRGGRMKIEKDRARVLSGIRHGLTLGSPVAIMVENRDWTSWSHAMDAWEPVAQGDYQPVTRPRPGHADLVGGMKYGHRDLRNVLERASARETAARVAAGALARVLLLSLGMAVGSHITRVGAASAGPAPTSFDDPGEICSWQDVVDKSPLRCQDAGSTRAMMAAIDDAREGGHSLGGVFEIVSTRMIPGLGSYVHWDRRLDTQLGGALMGIPGIKGVEIGDGFSLAAVPGNSAHDDIVRDNDRLVRPTNRAGGLEGGVTTGEPLVIRCAMKPIATQAQPLQSVDLATGEPSPAQKERADICAVPSAGVIGEAVVALVLAGAVLSKFGGDNMDDIRDSAARYRKRVSQA